jgi:hypothetical protein
MTISVLEQSHTMLAIKYKHNKIDTYVLKNNVSHALCICEKIFYARSNARAHSSEYKV